MRTISRDELNEILSLHNEWLESNGNHGKRAYLGGAYLRGADLGGANLEGADLRGAYLGGAKSLLSFGPMPTSGRIIYAVWHGEENGWIVQAGCFWGNLDELEKRVKGTHNCPVYLGIINILRNHKPKES